MIGGSKGWADIADFGRIREGWLKTIGGFSNSIPSHDTVERVVTPGYRQALSRYFF